MKKYMFLTLGLLVVISSMLINNNYSNIQSPLELKKNSVFKVIVYNQQNEPPSSEGTAFAIGDNEIITNYHVVKYPQKILLYNLEGDEFLAKLKSYDIKTDLAILELSKTIILDALPLSNSDIQKQDITFVANRGNIEKGLIKDISKTIDGYNESIFRYFELKNIKVENGSSGSPVFNKKGEVVGIVSAKAFIDNELLGYAIPISDAMGVINSLTKGIPYHHNILGIEAVEITNTNQYFPGLIVTKVHDKKLDNEIKVNDIIKRFDGNAITNINDLGYELFKAINSQKHNILIIRDNEYIKILIKLNKDS